MKTMNLLLVGIFAFVASDGYASVRQDGSGNGAGNGGGLIERNGKILTFSSAGVTIPLPFQELEESDLPELDRFRETLDRIVLTPELKYQFIKTTQLSEVRRYFKVDLSAVPSVNVQTILDTYRKTISTHPEDKIVLAAITKGNETYLFDAYFKLDNQNSKLAIMAHEAFWVTKPDSKYADVIDSEIEFENCLKLLEGSPKGPIYCGKWIDTLAKLTGEPTLPLRTAAYDDLAAGRLATILDFKGRIPLSFLVPADFFTLSVYDYFNLKEDSIHAMIDQKLLEESLKHPDVRMIKQLRRRIPKMRILGIERAVYVKYPDTEVTGNPLNYDINRTLSSAGVQTLGFKPWDRQNNYRVQLSKGLSSRGVTISPCLVFGWLLSESDQLEESTVVLQIN